MFCRTARRMIYLYKPDELSQSERSRLERHIERCSECAAEAMAARRTRQVVAALADRKPVLHDPEEFTRYVLASVKSEQERVWLGQRRTSVFPFPLRGIQLASGVSLMFIVLALIVQTYSDARKVSALEERLNGEVRERAVRTVAPGAKLDSFGLPLHQEKEVQQAGLLGLPRIPALKEKADPLPGKWRHTLIDYIARNYPELASINLEDGLDEQERAILATDGGELLSEREFIVRAREENNAK